MTRVFADPAQFKSDAIAGFTLAYSDYVERVPGASGFVRRGGTRADKVALVIGGGSGHYPSYSGVTGHGFADGAVLGEVFTSPSAEEIYRVARAADGGAGVIFGFGNYAGDRLNFGVAAERLRAEGIDTRIVYVTDDVASAGPEEIGKRRGIAGTFAVFKIAGAAAERGDDIDAVERIMRQANAQTYSFGAAFAGCTFPGQEHPLFNVAEGTIEIGLGIHGEPGIRTAGWLPAPELAEVLVAPLLETRPSGAARAAVILNGLGSTKYEELFVLWAHVDRLLRTAGLEIVQPEVGEFVTSLNMSGCSLSITWLDAELESLWTAPADTPAYRRGASEASGSSAHERYIRQDSVEAIAVAVAVSAESLKVSNSIRQALIAAKSVVDQNEDLLARIDAIAGDGDHGSGMVRGFRAATEAAALQGGARTVLTTAGAAFAEKAGGTSGILWGRFLQDIGSVLGDEPVISLDLVATAIRSGAEGMKSFGGAELGDKTMLDALFPFVDSLDACANGDYGLAEAWAVASKAATTAAAATANLIPRVGRARPLAERSLGNPDAGATSMALILNAVARQLDKEISADD